MVGKNPYSTTRMKGSGTYYEPGIISTTQEDGMTIRLNMPYVTKPSVTPVVTSAYYIRAAKILRLAAKELGFKKT